MSQENVEIVRRLYAEAPFRLAIGPDDERAVLDRLFRDHFEEQLEIRMPADYPEGEQVLRGREGFAQLVGMLRETWTEFRFEAERFIDAGGRVAVFVRVLAEGGASGVATERKRRADRRPILAARQRGSVLHALCPGRKGCTDVEICCPERTVAWNETRNHSAHATG